MPKINLKISKFWLGLAPPPKRERQVLPLSLSLQISPLFPGPTGPDPGAVLEKIELEGTLESVHPTQHQHPTPIHYPKLPLTIFAGAEC